jgi:uncharacterized Zn finger protein
MKRWNRVNVRIVVNRNGNSTTGKTAISGEQGSLVAAREIFNVRIVVNQNGNSTTGKTAISGEARKQNCS